MLLPRLEEKIPLNEGKSEYFTGYCVNSTMGMGEPDTWPTEFISIPRVGDFVRSREGNTLKVIEVVYLVRETPTFELMLGKDVSSSSPMEGGATAIGID
jgi:hypothetical protein